MSASNDWTVVAKTTDIPEGQGRAYPVGDVMVAVFHEGGEFFAIDDFCPHQGASLAEGYLCDGEVACPLHAWRFSIRSGAWVDNPRVAVNTFEVQVEGGTIKVRPQAAT